MKKICIAVAALLAGGLDSGSTAMQAIGYKEAAETLRGECSREEAVDKIKRETRRYAKRQLTFLRGMENINFVDIEEKDYQKKMENMIERWKNG